MRTLTRVLFVLVLLTLTVPALAQEEEAPVMGFWEECESPTALPESVNIGAIFVQSGNASVYGIVQTQAVEMAVAEINEAGYLGEGVELVVTFADSAGVAEQAIGAMESLLESGVVAVLGPTLST